MPTGVKTNWLFEHPEAELAHEMRDVDLGNDGIVLG